MTVRTLKIAAIVLAAGRSLRMAPRNKLLELVDGKPVIAHVVNAALRSGAETVIVVTGFEAPRLEEAMRGLNVTIVHNASYERHAPDRPRGIAAEYRRCVDPPRRYA